MSTASGAGRLQADVPKGLHGRVRGSRWVHRAMLVLMLAGSSLAHAQDRAWSPSVHAGASWSPGAGPTAALLVDVEHDGGRQGRFFAGFSVGVLNTRGEQSGEERAEFASARLGWRHRAVALSSGPAWLNRSTPALDGHLQFHTQLTVHLRRWRLGLGHLSNAGRRGANRGESFVTMGRAW